MERGRDWDDRDIVFVHARPCNKGLTLASNDCAVRCTLTPMPIRLGTQGWNYDAWVGPFYPIGTRAANYLSLYARAFDTVEVDSTFYAIPSVNTLRGWAARVPDGF